MFDKRSQGQFSDDSRTPSCMLTVLAKAITHLSIPLAPCHPHELALGLMIALASAFQRNQA